MPEDFEAWARGIVTNKRGEEVARETFEAVEVEDEAPRITTPHGRHLVPESDYQPPWNEAGEKDNDAESAQSAESSDPLPIEVIQEAASFAALGVEAFIDVGGWTFVLTPTLERAAHWSKQVGHVGITPEEVEILGRASGGPIDSEMLKRIAAVKRTFPGAHVLQALKKGEDNGSVQDVQSSSDLGENPQRQTDATRREGPDSLHAAAEEPAQRELIPGHRGRPAGDRL